MRRSFVTMVMCLVATATSEDWAEFKATHKKAYGTEAEESRRERVFRENALLVEAHNARYRDNLESYWMKVDRFADLTDEEFGRFLTMGGGRPNVSSVFFAEEEEDGAVSDDIPDAFDWRDFGAVTEVRDQGSCGSCWAFSAIGSVESHNFIKSGGLFDLSEQQLIDCSGAEYLNHGCNGGFMDTALAYITVHGITTEQNYPYQATDQNCHYSDEHSVVRFGQIGTTVSGREDSLKRVVAQKGPVSVGVDATGFRFYAGGVYSSDSCSSKEADLNHGMVVVGYGYDYWIVKNSWGEGWGENGYILMSRDKNNQCGIATYTCYPIF